MEDRVVCTCLDITYNTIKEAIENGAKTWIKDYGRWIVHHL